MHKILITGASGLIGTRLTHLLLQKGYNVNTLGRRAQPANRAGLKNYVWDVEAGEVDQAAFEGVTAIVNLAGAGVAEKRWTDKRKTEIIESRLKSGALIYDQLKRNKGQVEVFISPSGIDYYGDCGTEIVTEEHPLGSGFLADVTMQWERNVKWFAELGIREVRCRVGVVLAKEGGALPELIKTAPFGIAPYFAKTPLYYAWVHIDDVCGIITHAIENKQVSGAYNTTAPNPLPIKDMMREILRAKKSHALLVPVPTFALRLMLGEQADMLLGSHICSAEKIEATGYRFKYPDIKGALEDLFQSTYS